MTTKKSATKAKKPTKKTQTAAKKKTTTKTKKAASAKKTTKASKKTATKSTQPSRVKGTIKRSLKLKSVEKQIALSFYAPLAQAVQIAGSFNNWSAGDLVKDDHGTWQTTLHLQPGRYEYKYLIDGRWENAQNEHEMVDNGHGGLNSVLTVA